VPDFDLKSARLVRLQQGLDALLPGEDPIARAEILHWLSLGARQGLDLMPAFHRTLRSFQKHAPARRTAERNDAASESGATLAMEVLPAPHRATLWPVRPKLLPGELLSSWLWRTASEAGAPPRRFVHDVIGSHLPDVDRDTAIARLAFLSGQPDDDLLRGTMRADVPPRPSDPFTRVQQALLRHGDLVLNRTRRGRSTPIIQYCPVCLGRGAAAHLRRGWRFSIEVVCVIDGCFLLDACWRCGATLDPLALGRPSIAFLCTACGVRLAAAPSLHMPETLHDQKILFAGLSCMLFAGESEHIMLAGQAYIDELSAGALRGTNPANPAERHHAVMVEADRLRDAALRPRARAKGRRHATSGRHRREPACLLTFGRRHVDRSKGLTLFEMGRPVPGELQARNERARHGSA
jgi:hypothetical protein